ncbi:unnamed protein product [Acanthosepion pharaonis]|uniref:Uncharacterized protein n=1 Tax=Acanthosepion pharaonis TaxID=158019 RepID=A0A812AQ60_ACAPH|nr:unnamed protein product [Sepia pharaonis]
MLFNSLIFSRDTAKHSYHGWPFCTCAQCAAGERYTLLLMLILSRSFPRFLSPPLLPLLTFIHFSFFLSFFLFSSQFHSFFLFLSLSFPSITDYIFFNHGVGVLQSIMAWYNSVFRPTTPAFVRCVTSCARPCICLFLSFLLRVYSFFVYLVAGPPGLPGLRGPVGPKGDKGPRGENGLQGIPGQPGPIGLTGPMGDPGIDGKDGDKGSTGSPGPTGPRGSMGLRGKIGINGFPGNDGEKKSVGDIVLICALPAHTHTDFFTEM